VPPQCGGRFTGVAQLLSEVIDRDECNNEDLLLSAHRREPVRRRAQDRRHIADGNRDADCASYKHYVDRLSIVHTRVRTVSHE
jgi:hypothetical protein